MKQKRMARREARQLTLEVLYEFDIAGKPPVKILQRRLGEQALTREGVSFALELIQGIVGYLAISDEIIEQYAPEWPLDQMAVIDRNILRIAIYEFLMGVDTPMKVAINEAVELAKEYGSDSAPRFINGVLGTLANELPQLKIRYLAPA